MTGRKRPRDWSGLAGWALLLLLVLAWVALVPYRVLQRAGWQESPAEELLGGPPDRAATQALQQAAQAEGLGPQGVRFYVLPLAQSGDRVAFAVLDAAQGYHWDRLLDWEEISQVLLKLSSAGRDLDLWRLALHYLGEQGELLLTVTVSAQAVQSYQRGSISSDELLLETSVNGDVRRLLAERRP